jgi:glycosidase
MTTRLAALILSLALAAGCATPSTTPAADASVATNVAERSALYEVFVRDFSPDGDLAGVRAGLDRIAATGADVVWLMPIHPIGVVNRKGTIGSPYSIRDYRPT